MACDISIAKVLLEDSLANHYDKRELKNIVKFYFEDKFEGKTQLNDNDENVLFEDILLLKNNKPLQYVVGKSYFYDRFLEVNESTLIPRPETEELVRLILESNANDKNFNIVDIGTGSGCIPILLKAKGNFSNVKGIDVSRAALETAIRNAAKFDLKIEFEELDFLNKENWQKLSGFNCIVSNPPYISHEEKTSMSKNVLDYEPHIALFVEDPLLFYEKIAKFCIFDKNVKYVFLEINPLFAPNVIELFIQLFPSVKIAKDMQGKDRMLAAMR